MTAADPAAVRTAVARLMAAGCVLPEEEVDAALEAWTGAGPTVIHRRLDDYIDRRGRGEPPAYILGGTRFRGEWVRVGRGAFIPRPWTEAVAATALELLPGAGNSVDVGTGAGPLALALAVASPASHIWATDIDREALRWAQVNLGPLANVTILEGDLLGRLPPALRGQVDLLAGCLPYVPTTAVAELPRDFRENEPALAFDGGTDGLRLVGRTLADATGWLRPGGWIVLEIGARQGGRAIELCRQFGYRDVEARRDGAGDDAMIVAQH